MDIRGLVLGCLTNFFPQGPGVWELQAKLAHVCYIHNRANYQNSFLTSTFDTTVVPTNDERPAISRKIPFSVEFLSGKDCFS